MAEVEVAEALEQITAIIDKVFADRSVSQEETKSRLEELKDEIRCHLETSIESLG